MEVKALLQYLSALSQGWEAEDSNPETRGRRRAVGFRSPPPAPPPPTWKKLSKPLKGPLVLISGNPLSILVRESLTSQAAASPKVPHFSSEP